MPAVHWSRRDVLRYALAGGAGIVGASLGVQALTERHRLAVERVDVPIAGLPAELVGLTICQLADLHRGPRVAEGHIRHAADIATSLGADVIVVTGDFVSQSWRFARSCAEALSVLRAPSGVFAVRGNHDYWAGDVDEVDRAVSRAGIEILTNRGARLRHHGHDWWLCGVDDVWSGRPDPQAALRGAPNDAFRVLLCHEPDYADTVAGLGVPLLLSGHSHGGQVIIPGLGPVILPEFGKKYPLGLRRVTGSASLIYTTRGVGVSLLPIRINCPPEISVLRLRQARLSKIQGSS